MYDIIFEKSALHQLKKFDKEIRERIWNKLQECKGDPFRFFEHLEDIKGFKLRIGDYRVIADINNSTIIVLKVGHRKNIYDYH